MRVFMIEPVADPVTEARRYVENAKTTLAKHGNYDPETGCYQDSKYVKAAGLYLWCAVLLILDALFQVKTSRRRHPDINDYLDPISKRDKKLLTLVHAAYGIRWQSKQIHLRRRLPCRQRDHQTLRNAIEMTIKLESSFSVMRYAVDLLNSQNNTYRQWVIPLFLLDIPNKT